MWAPGGCKGGGGIPCSGARSPGCLQPLYGSACGWTPSGLQPSRHLLLQTLLGRMHIIGIVWLIGIEVARLGQTIPMDPEASLGRLAALACWVGGHIRLVI